MSKISRRAFLGGGAIAAAGVLAGTGLLNETTSDFELVRTAIPVRNLPIEFEGYTVAFMSDLHCGSCFPLKWVEQALGLALRDPSR